MAEVNCERCGSPHNGSFGSGRFCSRSCSNNKGPRTEEIKSKISITLTGKGPLSEERKQKMSISLGGLGRLERTCEVCRNIFVVRKQKEKNRRFCSEKCSKIGKRIKVKKSLEEIASIIDCSRRTSIKILRRLGKMYCSNCGWDKGTCDIHHISGRKIENPDSHNNLSLLCPNCHRLVHEKKITKQELIAFSDFLPENWKDAYLVVEDD